MESPFQSMRGAGTLAGAAGASRFTRLARRAMGTMPGAVRAAALTVGRATAKAVTASDIEARLHRARRVFDDIDLFVAPSSALADEYARLGINPRKLKVSDYGFVPLRNVQREPRDGRLRLGFVGTLVWHKGLHVLIEALRRVADPRVTLAIHGNTSTFPDYVTELRRLAHGLPVEFRGGFDSGRVGEVYGTFDVLVVPSIWPENSPLVIHEAFMAGVPVVGARSGGVAGLISDGHSGLLCEPGNVDSLASAIRRLLDDPSLAARLARGVPPVKSIEQDAAEWDAVYTQLLACKVAS